MNRKLNSLFIFHCRRRLLSLSGARTRPSLLGKARNVLNKNPNSSDKTRTPYNSACSGFPLVPPSSSDKIALDPSTAPRRMSCLFDFPRPVPAHSGSSPEHNSTYAPAQVEISLPRVPGFPGCRSACESSKERPLWRKIQSLPQRGYSSQISRPRA